MPSNATLRIIPNGPTHVRADGLNARIIGDLTHSPKALCDLIRFFSQSSLRQGVVLMEKIPELPPFRSDDIYLERSSSGFLSSASNGLFFRSYDNDQPVAHGINTRSGSCSCRIGHSYRTQHVMVEEIELTTPKKSYLLRRQYGHRIYLFARK